MAPPPPPPHQQQVASRPGQAPASGAANAAATKQPVAVDVGKQVIAQHGSPNAADSSAAVQPRRRKGGAQAVLLGLALLALAALLLAAWKRDALEPYVEAAARRLHGGYTQLLGTQPADADGEMASVSGAASSAADPVGNSRPASAAINIVADAAATGGGSDRGAAAVSARVRGAADPAGQLGTSDNKYSEGSVTRL